MPSRTGCFHEINMLPYRQWGHSSLTQLNRAVTDGDSNNKHVKGAAEAGDILGSVTMGPCLTKNYPSGLPPGGTTPEPQLPPAALAWLSASLDSVCR